MLSATGTETVMDGEGVPMATRQNRLGHSDARTTMKYTHVVSEDGPQNRGTLRRTADILADGGDDGSGKRFNFGPNSVLLRRCDRIEVAVSD